MAGHWTPTGGNFPAGSPENDVNLHQLGQQEGSDMSNPTASRIFPQSTSGGDSAMHYASPEKVARGLSGGFYRSSTAGRNVAPNYLDPLVRDKNLTHDADPYPAPNFYPSMPYGDARHSQNQQAWPGSWAPMSNDYQQHQPHNLPAIHSQNPRMAPNYATQSESALLQQANTNADKEPDLEEDYLNPETGRSVRKLLEHEKVLLKHFFSIKNPFVPIPSKRQLHLWQLSLPDKFLDEWNDFVLQNQTQSEAQDRAESVENYRVMLIAMKDKIYDIRRSEHRGSKYGAVGRPVGSQNKPKNQTPKKKVTGVSKRATPSKKATPAKSASAKKGKKVRRPVQENDDDDFDPEE